MCAAPTSAADRWTGADADWERLQGEAADALAAGDPGSAAARWAEALRLARANFDPDDPRLATSLANQAIGLRLRGEPAAGRLLTEALRVCDRAPGWIARHRSPRGARSSSFHLRLEARHPGAYEANQRRRMAQLTAEVRATVEGLAAGASAEAPGRAARQAVQTAPFDPMRKVLGALHLLARAGAPPAKDAQAPA